MKFLYINIKIKIEKKQPVLAKMTYVNIGKIDIPLHVNWDLFIQYPVILYLSSGL